MSENETGPQPDEAIKAWIKKSMDDMVQELMDRGVLDSIVAEARPAWMLPFTLLIGQVREHGNLGGVQPPQREVPEREGETAGDRAQVQ